MRLVSADEPAYNLVYIANQLVTANFTTRPPGSNYSGFGEKARAQVLIVWFSHASPDGSTHYDSDQGNNFRFSFPSRELRVVAADVVSNEQTHESVFTVEIACHPHVDRVLVRARAVNDEGFEKEIDLTRSDAAGKSDPQGWPRWTLPKTPVPPGAIIEFKVYYWMRSVRYKDDNSGRYYLVPTPKRTVPPPPRELAAAAQRWAQPPSSGTGG
jgi:hypothetical protein